MQTFSEGLKFSSDKPNVIVGPNGSGKSALINSLSYLTLSHTVGHSCFDSFYVNGNKADDYWEPDSFSGRFGYSELFKGLEADWDFASAVFYQPKHIPGDYSDLTHALMCGYSEEAKQLDKMTKRKSSGQVALAVMDYIRGILRSEVSVPAWDFVNWGYSKEIRDLDKYRESHISNRANNLMIKYAEAKGSTFKGVNKVPTVLMDEPEQSLDTLQEFKLWSDIENADCSKIQVIVASHSIYPLIHPDKFNLIETVPGFIADCKKFI